MDTYTAVQIIEGDVTAEEEDIIDAYQSLIDSGVAWQLQGSIGRMAASLIESGYCRAKED
jgi:hypothetical protein